MTDKKSKEVQYCVFFTTFTFGLEFFCFITVMHAAYFIEFLNQKPSTFQTTGGGGGGGGLFVLLSQLFTSLIFRI